MDGVVETLGLKGYQAELQRGVADVPDCVVVDLDAGAMQIMQLDMDGVPMLQYFIGVPLDAPPHDVTALARFVCALNVNLPLTGFEISEARGQVFFRHMQVAVDPHVVAFTTELCDFVMARFAPLIVGVATHMTFEQGVAALVDNLHNWEPEPQ